MSTAGPIIIPRERLPFPMDSCVITLFNFRSGHVLPNWLIPCFGKSRILSVLPSTSRVCFAYLIYQWGLACANEKFQIFILVKVSCSWLDYQDNWYGLIAHKSQFCAVLLGIFLAGMRLDCYVCLAKWRLPRPTAFYGVRHRYSYVAADVWVLYVCSTSAR